MNLIICVTNLQILIAERIIDLYPNEEFYGLLYINKNNTKNEYYAKRLKQKCSKFEIIYLEDLQGNNYISRHIKPLQLLLKSYFLPKIDKIFIASLDLTDIHLYLHTLSNSEVITFDDGSLNLNPKAFYHLMKLGKSGSLVQFLCKFFTIPSWIELFNRKTKHYSIYRYPNVMGKSTFINLFPYHNLESKNINLQETRRIMLGQHIYGYSPLQTKQNIEVTEAIIKKMRIDYYYPHPRENYKISSVNYIDSPYVFEEYIMKEIENNPNTEFEVYSYCSSVLLNLSGIKCKQLAMVAIRPSSLPDTLSATYETFKAIGIPIKELEY